MELSRIKEVGVKSIFPELRKEPDHSIRVNLANSVFRDIPKFITLGHTTIETVEMEP